MSTPPAAHFLASCLAAALLAGCSREHAPSTTYQRPSITTAAQTTGSVALVTPTMARPTDINILQTTPGTPETSSATAQAAATLSHEDLTLGPLESGLISTDDLVLCATNFIESLLNNDQTTAQSLADLSFTNQTSIWLATFADTPSNGRVIDALIITNAAGHATIGVSVAFPTAADGTINEPIAYLVETIKTPNGWQVIGISYA